MPVATHGAVKTLTSAEVVELGAKIVLSNTYHLHLRPGETLIAKQGGLHKFMHWSGPILTDSGGYQVFSLGHRHGGQLAKIDDLGVTFTSHLDGSEHRFTPEKVLKIQQRLGVDIMMPLDECPSSTANHPTVCQAVARTHRWLERAVNYWQKNLSGRPALFGIVQGGVNKKLRAESIAFVSSQPVSGIALGGLAVGEGTVAQRSMVAWAAPQLPAKLPHYLMGVGEPLDLLWAVGQGIDLFDCVLPTRLARHGTVWVVTGPKETVQAFWEGETAKLLAAKSRLKIERRAFPRQQFATKKALLQPESDQAPAGYLSYAYANHLAKEKEIMLLREFSRQNLKLLFLLLQHARAAIKTKQYTQLAKVFGLNLNPTPSRAILKA